MDTRRREHLSLWRPVGTVMLPDETLLVRPHTTDAGRRELHDREAAHNYAAALWRLLMGENFFFQI